MLMGFVFCLASLEVWSEPGAKKAQRDERAQRIPVLALTDEIHVSSSRFSGPCIEIHHSGQLVFVPFPSARVKHPEGSQFSAPGVLNFAHWHAMLASRPCWKKGVTRTDTFSSFNAAVPPPCSFPPKRLPSWIPCLARFSSLQKLRPDASRGQVFLGCAGVINQDPDTVLRLRRRRRNVGAGGSHFLHIPCAPCCHPNYEDAPWNQLVWAHSPLHRFPACHSWRPVLLW